MTTLSSQQLFTAIQARFPTVSMDPSPSATPTVIVAADHYRALMEHLRADPALAFDFPMSHTAVDWPDRKTITAVSHLSSMEHGHQLAVKCDLDRERPVIATCCDLWRGFEWFEREVYDMFGVVYDGHPDLRRILMTDDWIGFPLRKDYMDSRIAGKPF